MSYFDKFSSIDLESALKFTCLMSSRTANETYVFMFPTYERSKQVSREFETLIESIPEWARVKIVSRNSRDFRFDNGFKVRFLNSPIHLKGLTMNAFFIADEWKREDIGYIAPCLTHCSCVTRID